MEKINELDELYMKRAIELAKKAAEIDEVPIGALIVRRGEIIYEAYNRRETDKLATAHVELHAIEGACKALGGWRLPESTLYVTLEPCAMCAGAIINARVERVVFGASDIRFGAFGSLVDLSALPFNHKPEILGGVLGEECRELLSSFFKKKRKAKEGALATDIDN